MLCYRVIPSLLVKNGRLVKGVQFIHHKDAGNPSTTARAHNAQKADELILLDIDASKEHRSTNIEIVKNVANEIQMPLTVGGGISNVNIADECLSKGADKLCLTTVAIDNPGLVDEFAKNYGSQAIMVSVDVLKTRDGYHLYDHRTQDTLKEKDWLLWVDEVVDRGAGEIRIMSVNSEGTRKGYDLDLWKLVKERVNVPVILEGGASTLTHISDAMLEGVDALALGTMLVFSDNNIIQIKRHLKNSGLPIRL